jgi:DNA-binding transcriptional LysR family regulator
MSDAQFSPKFHHLKALCEIVEQDLHLSNAAYSLHRSQPALTRQIQQLEDSLGIILFERNRNRLLRLTEQGAQVVEIARRMVSDARDLGRLAEDSKDDSTGKLTIATTHTQARYTLPTTIQRFMKEHKGVELTLLQGTPVQCCDRVAQGQADIAICAEVSGRDDVVQIPCYRMQRIVVTPPGHPLLDCNPLTLEQVCRYPIITYGEGFNGRAVVDHTFRNAGLQPKVILRAIDADVSKTYVEMGLGIAILASVTFDEARDGKLRRIEARHLFGSSMLSVVMRPNSYLRNFTRSFIQTFAGGISRIQIQQALSRTGTPNQNPPEL